MDVKRCDRCGSVCRATDKMRIIQVDEFCPALKGFTSTTHFDLCECCYKKFTKWIKQYDTIHLKNKEGVQS